MPKTLHKTAERGPGSFDIITYEPGENGGGPEGVRQQIFDRTGQLWGVIAVGMEGRDVVDRRTFGNRAVIAGTAWVALHANLQRYGREERPYLDVLDIMVDVDGPGQLGVFAVFDSTSLEIASDRPANLAYLDGQVQSRINPLHFWKPRTGLTLDDAALAVFVTPDTVDVHTFVRGDAH
jgi:hypothetical protein